MKNKQNMIAALEECKRIITMEVVKSIKIGDFTNARKYTTTSKHLCIAADFLEGKNG